MFVLNLSLHSHFLDDSLTNVVAPIPVYKLDASSEVLRALSCAVLQGSVGACFLCRISASPLGAHVYCVQLRCPSSGVSSQDARNGVAYIPLLTKDSRMKVQRDLDRKEVQRGGP